jgi:hypothetical protein
MRVFLGVAPNQNHSSIRGGVAALMRTCVVRGLGEGNTSWSLVELQPDEDDFDWLCTWAASLDWLTARTCLGDSWGRFNAEGRKITQQAAIGCLLLMLSSEVARRDATEGTLWPYVRHDRRNKPRFSTHTSDELFDFSGQPTRAHKDALEAAARHFNLRNVFDEEDMQCYFVTVFLQCGFTLRNAQSRLADWLIGHTLPVAVDHLLSGPLSSLTFRDLWDRLKCYRANNITEAQFRAYLVQSPWVLADWVEDLARAARRAVTTTVSTSATAETNVVAVMPFLSQPALHWTPPGEPQFVCEICNLPCLELTEDEYDLRIGGKTVARLIRQSDESYRAAPSAEVVLSVVSHALAADLIVRDGPVVHSMTLTLWDQGQDVNVYRLPNGQPIKPGESLSTRTDYAVFFASDLTIEPRPRWYQIIGEPEVQCSVLSGTDLAETRVLTGDTVLWRPIFTNQPRDSEPSWAQSVSVVLQEERDGEVELQMPNHLVVRHPTNVSVRFVRFQMRPLSFRGETEARTVAGPLMIPPGAARRTLEFTIGLICQSEQARITRRIPDVAITGAAKLHADVWTILPEQNPLSAEVARAHQFQVLPPRIWHGKPVEFREWALMEGSTWIGRLSHQPRPLGELAGLGAKLTVCRGPFNSDGDAISLTNEVVNRGLLRDVILDESYPADGSTRQLRLELDRGLEPDEYYDVFWWDISGNLQRLRPRPFQKDGVIRNDWWEVDVPRSLSRPLVVAIAYSGVRKGAWWPWDWFDPLPDLGEEKPSDVAVRLRWFKLPILSKASVSDVRKFAQRHPAPVLKAWMLDNDAPEPLRWNMADEGWFSAIREIFRDWWPSSSTVEELVQGMASISHTDPPIVRLAWSLIRLDPLIMAKVIRSWRQTAQGRSTVGDKLFQRLKSRVSEFTSVQSVRRDSPAKQRLLGSCSQLMQVDPKFVEELLDAAERELNHKHVEWFERDNLEVAIGAIEPFRQLLAGHLLTQLR